MSLWLERLNELTRYYNLLREADQHRLAREGQQSSKNSDLLVRRFMAWLGFCLSASGSQLQKHYGVYDRWKDPAVLNDGNANRESNKQ